MIKILTIIISMALLVVSCNQTPTTKPYVPQQPLPSSPPVTPNGTMTNQAPEDMEPITLDGGNEIPPKELLGYVQQAIIPIYKDWVVLKNGTYIIFDNIDTIPDIKKAAMQLIEQYRPKTAEDNNWNFTISDLDQTQGWSVYGNGYGIYTYIHPKELSDNPDPQQIGTYAKAKRALDEKKPEILFISSKEGITEVR